MILVQNEFNKYDENSEITHSNIALNIASCHCIWSKYGNYSSFNDRNRRSISTPTSRGILERKIISVIKAVLPQHPLPAEQELSLLLPDAVLHDKYAAHPPAVQRFYQNQIINALDEMKNLSVTKGAKIWKLYNMDFVVCTKSITITFDLTNGEAEGSDEFTVPMNI